jgi:SAM-dependent methyltransferase
MNYIQLFGSEALQRVVFASDAKRVLDVGSGQGFHAEALRRNGKEVTTVSLKPPADYVGEYLSFAPSECFDCVWASHVLEHSLNVNLVVRKFYADLRDGGLLAVTVPPAKHAVVGGHVNLFNAGTLLYNLILGGFDCSDAIVSPVYVGGIPQPYNISVLVRKKKAELPELEYDSGDIEKLAKFFPMDVVQGFDGQLLEGVNWERAI